MKKILSIIFGVLAVIVIVSAVIYIITHNHTYKSIALISTLLGCSFVFIMSYISEKQNKKEKDELKNEIEKLKLENETLKNS